MVKKIKYLCVILTVAIFLATSVFWLPVEQVNAAGLTSQSIVFSTNAASTAAQETITFTTPTGITAGQTITITYPSAWTGISGLTADADITMLDGASAETVVYSATPTSAQVGYQTSGAVITLKLGSSVSVAGTHVVTIVIGPSTHKITNPVAGSYNINIGGTMADSGQVTGVFGNNIIAVSATVSQSMSFSVVSTSITLSPALSGSTTGYGSGTMSISTNASGGFAITASGSTLGFGAYSIAACASNCVCASAGCTDQQGTAQFGLNLVANTKPASFGAAASGSAPIGTAATNYNTANSYRFVSGDTVASYAGPVNTTTFTVSYIANVIALQQPGNYTTTLTYTATSTF